MAAPRGSGPCGDVLGSICSEPPTLALKTLVDNASSLPASLVRRGMVATAPMDGTEPVLRIPGKHVLQSGLSTCPSDCQGASIWPRLDWWGRLALLVLGEVHRGSASPLAAWIRTLPRDFSEIPLTWSEAELGQLRSPALAESVAEQRGAIRRAYREMSEACEVSFSEAEFLWAVLVVRSRAFRGAWPATGWENVLTRSLAAAAVIATAVEGMTVFLGRADGGPALALGVVCGLLSGLLPNSLPRTEQYLLCPGADFFNHDSCVHSEIIYDTFRDDFAVYAGSAYQTGDEVCINYGERARDNDALLQNYGFVERGCPHDTFNVHVRMPAAAQPAASTGRAARLRLTTRSLADGRALEELRELVHQQTLSAATQDTVSDEELWKHIAEACEAELRQNFSGVPALERGDADAAALAGSVASNHAVAAATRGKLAASFVAEKERVLRACHAHAEARLGRHRAVSAKPLPASLLCSTVEPAFEEAAQWRNTWAEDLLGPEEAAQLRDVGACVFTAAFDAELAQRCLTECEALDAGGGTCTSTVSCNAGSRYAWLPFDTEAQSRRLAPALHKLSAMLAGLPAQVNTVGIPGSHQEPLSLTPATYLAVYPARGAEYRLHKDSYVATDAGPSAGACRRLTMLAYFNCDWQPGDGG